MKRIISFLLSLIFIFSTLPLSALKISASPFMGGDGSEANPYLVGSPEALDAVRNNLTAHYQQTCNIDMSAWGNWVPIEDFKGVYDGREFEIKGITIVYSYKVSEATPYGLFATAQGASFKNIRLADLDIDIDEAETAYEAIYASGLQAGIVVGGICADAGNPVSDYSKQSYTLFENCTVSGNIRIMNCADVTVGGIVGRGFADISYCNNYANITVNANRMYDKNNLYNLVRVNCGGICGRIDNLHHDNLYSKATRYCSNSGKIEVWSNGYTGVSGIGFSFNIRECVNFGNIFASATEELSHPYSHYYIGGISSSSNAKNCINYGIISGCGKKINNNDRTAVSVGGICGQGRAEGCFNLSPSISAQYADQYNITSYANSAGRISGQNYYDSQSSVAYSYSSNQTKVNDTVPEPHTYESSGYGRNYNYRNGFDLTHEELLLEKTYGFDFKNTWIIEPSVGGPVLRNVSFVVDDDIPVIEKLDFAEYKYRADYLLSTTLTEAPFLTTLTTNEYNPAKIIVDSHPKGMNSAAAAWDAMNKAITAVNDGPGELIKDDITQRNMITAYIMQALKYQSRDIIADAIKRGASDWEGFVGLSEYIVNGFDGSTGNFADHAKSHRTEIQKALLEQSQKTDSPMQKLLTLKEFASLFDTLAGVCKDYNDLYNRINSYAMLYASTEETKAVINSMYELCPTSDTEIKLALGAAKEIMTAASDELLKKFINGEIFFTTLTTTSALMADLLWDQVNEVLAASFPGVAALCMLANAEMYVVDKFFGVSKSVEQYFKLCTIADLDALAGKVVEKAIEDYRNERNTENAKVLLVAIELKFGFIQESYSESIKYAEIINDEGIVRSAINALKMFLDIYDNSLKNSLQSGVVVIDEFHKNILTSWIYQLEYDYPLIAPLYDEYKNGINKSFTSKQCSVHCPVNITVYDAAGEIVAEVGEDNVWSSGKIAVVYDHGEKEIYFFDNAEYRIVCEGYDSGDMDISVTDYDSDGNVTRTVNYNNVPVSSGSLHTLSEEKVTDGESATLEADYDSSAAAPKNNITIKYGVISGYLFETQAAKGERIEISAIIPEGYRFVGWVGEVEFEDKKSASTYFFMPDGDVNISARLKKIENDDNDDKSNSGTPIIIIIAAAGGGIIFLGGVAVLIVAFNEKRKKSPKEKQNETDSL